MRIVSLLVIAATATSTAYAESPDVGEADRLFEEGRALAKEKRFSEACDRFGRSFALDPTIGTELNLADCHEQLGHLREAWRLFAEAADKSAKTDDRKRTTFARGRADTAAARLAEVVVRVARPQTAGLTISIAGRAMTVAAELRDRIEPGPIEVVATVPGHPPFIKSVRALAGSTVVVDVPAELAELPPRLHRQRTRVLLAWGLAGGSAIAGAVAGALTFKARSNYNTAADGPECMRISDAVQCTDAGDAKLADAQHLADLGTGFAIGCGVFAVAAVTLYFTAPRVPYVVTPLVTTQALGIAVGREF
ncbi:MAG: hypothetical protein ABI867_29045 [Kofleriaceae bacterium]